MADKVKVLTRRIRPQVRAISASALRLFDEEVSKIPGIIKLTLGEPDFNTPEHVKQAAIHSIIQNHTHYPQAAGTLGVRQAAANFLNHKYQLSFDPEELLITVGATEAIYVALGTVIDPQANDIVLLPTPLWSLYTNVVLLNGGIPVNLDTTDDGYRLTPEKLTAAFEKYGDRIKALVLNYPNNPTGVTYTKAQLMALVAVLRQHDCFVISDEVYAQLTYTQTHVSMAKLLPDQTILLSGVSKSHAMTGWRIGVIAAQRQYIREMFKVHQACVTSAAYVTQDAAQEAFANGEDDAAPMRAAYQQRGQLMYQALTKMGFDCVQPEGAFYLWCRLPRWLRQDSDTFCHELAYQNQVAVISGSAFAPNVTDYIRVSYAASTSQLKHAVYRIQQYIAKHKENK